MRITSSAFEHEGTIPKRYTCDGENINFPLTFHDVPKTAKSLVIIMDDPDVPKYVREDQMWDHWVVFNIPPETTHVDEGNEPKGTHGLDTAKTFAYYGPCPPNGEHRYFTNLYALDTELGLPKGATKKEIMKAMEGHILAKAILLGHYEREQE